MYNAAFYRQYYLCVRLRYPVGQVTFSALLTSAVFWFGAVLQVWFISIRKQTPSVSPYIKFIKLEKFLMFWIRRWIELETDEWRIFCWRVDPPCGFELISPFFSLDWHTTGDMRSLPNWLLIQLMMTLMCLTLGVKRLLRTWAIVAALSLVWVWDGFAVYQVIWWCCNML